MTSNWPLRGVSRATVSRTNLSSGSPSAALRRFRAAPEAAHAQMLETDAGGIDGRELGQEEAAREGAVGDDLAGAREQAGEADGRPLERRRHLDDVGAVERVDPPLRRLRAQRDREEEGPVHGMDDVVPILREQSPDERQLGWQTGALRS